MLIRFKLDLKFIIEHLSKFKSALINHKALLQNRRLATPDKELVLILTCKTIITSPFLKFRSPLL